MSTDVDPEGPLGVVAEGWEGVRGAELLRARLPKEDVVVVADHAFAPYARRRPADVVARVADLAAQLQAEGAKALLLAGGFASFEARPPVGELPVRGLECGLRDAVHVAAGRPVAAVFSPAEVKPAVLAKTIRGLRGGGSVTLIEHRGDAPADVLERAARSTPNLAVLLLLTPVAYAAGPALGALVPPEVVVIDALDSAARFLADDVRKRRLLAHHGLRAGRITTFATRGQSTAGGRPALPLTAAAALQRRL